LLALLHIVPSAQECIEILGRSLPVIINRSDPETRRDCLQAAHVARAYQYYSGHHEAYEQYFTSGDLHVSIQRLFEAMGTSPRRRIGQFFQNGSHIPLEIVTNISRNPGVSHQDLIKSLRVHLLEIDRRHQQHSSLQLMSSSDTETSMRIMFCIDKLNEALRPRVVAMPVNSPTPPPQPV
jgi:hypothetical protein